MNYNLPYRSRLLLIAWLGYVAFVVYAGLVPLQYRALPMAEAWAAFQKIRYLKLDVDLRADWVANGLLFVPVAFLTDHLLAQSFQRAPRLLLLATAGAFSVALAVSLEFAQLFFPPRTVKLNDIVSECLGSLLGLALSTRYAGWLQSLVKSILHDPRWFKVRLLEAYALAYLAFALFPFDFLLTWPELEAKFHSNAWGWLVAGNSPRLMLVGLKVVAEVLLTVPIGILLVRLAGGGASAFLRAAAIGILLGGFIETTQFFMYSGISQGLSVFSRALGVCFGVAICKYPGRWNADRIAVMLRRQTVPIGAAYLFVLLDINRWFVSTWHGFDFAARQLAQVNFVPLYYHYFAGEAQALLSLFVVCASYAPIAVLVWAHRRRPGLALAVSLAIATCVEAAKLFFEPAHPDPTNILLACASSWLAARVLNGMNLLNGPLVAKPEGLAQAGSRAVKPFPSHWPWLILSIVAPGIWVATFPAFPVLVCLVLIACGIAIWRRPVWIFAIVPAALPVFDLAPWSGRFFLDEFDALLFVGLAVAYSRVPVSPGTRLRPDPLFSMTVALVGLSFAISAIRGLLPLQLPDANSFNNYYSPYNAMRIVKGAVWAWLLYRLARRVVVSGDDVRRTFAWGMVFGLGLTVAVILWERLAFSGLWNFAAGYRVTGPFSVMHTGGAYVECFLVVAMPFLLTLLIEKRHWSVRLAGLMLLLATTYAMMVTFSRGAYPAFVVALFLVMLATIAKSRRLIRSAFVLAGLIGAILAVAVPIFHGGYAQSRMATVGADLAVRQEHWRDALAIREADIATSLFGMGIGRFPESSYWRSAVNPRSGSYQLKSEAGNTYLHLGSGDSIFVDQMVAVEPTGNYILKLDVRASRPEAGVAIPICEKWMLTSYNCIWRFFKLGKDFGTWRSIEAHFSAKELTVSPWYSRRPIKFSLTPEANSTIDFDNVQLQDEHGTELLRNGDFTQGLDHWFFSTDSHLQWHVKSMYYGVLFDQGWFGLLSLAAFLFLAIARTAKMALNGDVITGALLAALGGFLAVGLFDTLIDAPRFLLLLLLLASI